jgi:mannose-6-phosphate isomerase
MECEPAALLGAGPAVFPWLVKSLDACDWLSVQVHPDEGAVGRLWPGEGSKTEAWFVLRAGPSARIYAGLLPGVDEKRLRAALAAGTVADCLHRFVPRPGDCVFLPAGTVHAVGGGVLLAEVQQTSDATFRLFDWNRRDAQGRSRTLHVEEALACIDWHGGPVTPVRAAGYPDDPAAPALVGRIGNPPYPGDPARQRLVTCRYFTLDYVRQSAPFPCGGTGRLQVLIALHGRGRIEADGVRHDLGPGTTLVLPAALAAHECRPDGPLGVLLATLPPAVA